MIVVAKRARKRPWKLLKFLHEDTVVVFLALTWFGPRAMSLFDILETYDYLNHARLGDDELELALNTLQSAGLLEVQPGNMFGLAPGVYDRFQEFRKRRRRQRFDDASFDSARPTSPGRSRSYCRGAMRPKADG